MNRLRAFFIVLSVIASTAFGLESKDVSFGNQTILYNANVNQAIGLKRTMGMTKYKMTPGDTYQFIAQLNTTVQVPIVLDDNYQLEIPYIGNISVKGMYFADVRALIIKRIKARVPTQFVDFTLTSMALIDVFIYGGVANPGIATVTPINTLWDAIQLAQGFKRDASSRRIELIRNEKKTIIDLAKFIRYGDVASNPVLEQGDKIYVPHAEISCVIEGNVKYPDSYEMLKGETLADIIKFAGGALPGSLENEIQVSRLENERIIAVEIATFAGASAFKLQNGDKIRVRSMLESKESILVEGALFGRQFTGDEPQTPPTRSVFVSIPYLEGITLLQIVEKLGGPSPLADAEKSAVLRNSTNERIPVNVKKLMETRDPALDVVLKPNDHIFIPMRNLTVSVGGEVVKPGAFPFMTGMRVLDYIKLAGGIRVDTADMNNIYILDEKGKRTTVKFETEVPQSAIILVSRSCLTDLSETLSQLSIIIGFVSASIGLASLGYNLYHNLTSKPADYW